MNARIFLLAGALACGGCGMSYDYDTYIPKLEPGSGRAVAFAIVDERPDVVSGGQPPARVGTLETFFAFAMTTSQGHPLADDFTTALEGGLDKAGFKPHAVRLQPGDTAATARERLAATHDPRQLLIEVQEWQLLLNDFAHTLRQHYKVRFGVLDASGKELAAQQYDKNVTENPLESEEESLFERLCEGVLNSPDISKALRGA